MNQEPFGYRAPGCLAVVASALMMAWIIFQVVRAIA
jgi:hypothetical protein